MPNIIISTKKTSTLAIFCDLFKAFDIIDHDILLHKLDHYGLRGVVNDWLRSYLNNRKQYVDLKHAKSRHNCISCGVPQGSILGPLLYLLYVNDIGVACDGKIYSFADDTTLLTSSVTNLGCVRGQYHTNNEQTQSVEGII